MGANRHVDAVPALRRHELATAFHPVMRMIVVGRISIINTTWQGRTFGGQRDETIPGHGDGGASPRTAIASEPYL